MAEPRSEEYFKQFIGVKLGNDKYRIKGRKISAYAKSIGDVNPEFYVEPPEGDVKADFSGIVAHPAYAATYTIPGLLSQLPEMKGSDGEPLIRNIGKIMHTAQSYDFEGCVPLTAADKRVVTESEIVDLFIKKEMLWIELLYTTKSEDGSKIFCKTTIKGLLRKGGF